MRFPDLRGFLEELRREGELAVVEAPVDPRLEVAEIHRRVIGAGGPALLFTEPQNSGFPLVTNLFGTAGRAEKAFGSRPQKVIRRVVDVVETIMPPSPRKLWEARDLAAQMWRLGTTPVRKAPVAEVMTRDIRLDLLPVVTS